MNNTKTVKKYFSNVGDRKNIKNNIIYEFLDEAPGDENNSSKYKYEVEDILSDNDSIYLQRPGSRNKGVDFVIFTSKTNFSNDGEKKRRNPKHDDILNDLKNKKNESETEFLKMKSMIDDIYDCSSDVSIDDCRKLKFNIGFSVELILKVLKWMFIEQDVTYWNFSGRKMLKKKIDEI